MYEFTETAEGDTNFKVIRRLSDQALIPVDEANSDYQQYLVDTDGGLPTPKQTEGE